MKRSDKCPKCGVKYSIENTTKDSKRWNGLRWLCRSCTSTYRKPYRNKERDRKALYRYRRYIKLEVLKHYGSTCKVCGEANTKILTLDHINNNGAQHRRDIAKKSKGGIDMWMWVYRNKFPEGFQILCYNCNCGKQHGYGKEDIDLRSFDFST